MVEAFPTQSLSGNRVHPVGPVISGGQFDFQLDRHRMIRRGEWALPGPIKINCGVRACQQEAFHPPVGEVLRKKPDALAIGWSQPGRGNHGFLPRWTGPKQAREGIAAHLIGLHPQGCLLAGRQRDFSLVLDRCVIPRVINQKLSVDPKADAIIADRMEREGVVAVRRDRPRPANRESVRVGAGASINGVGPAPIGQDAGHAQPRRSADP